jgi:hypothetical protein
VNFCYWVTKTNPAQPIEKIFVKQKMCRNIEMCQRGKKSEIVIFNTIGSSYFKWIPPKMRNMKGLFLCVFHKLASKHKMKHRFFSCMLSKGSCFISFMF